MTEEHSLDSLCYKSKDMNKACAGAATAALHVGYHKEQVEYVRK